MADQLNRADYRALARLRLVAPAVRTPRGWRIGTTRLGDSIAERLVRHGKAVVTGDRLELLGAVARGIAEGAAVVAFIAMVAVWAAIGSGA